MEFLRLLRSCDGPDIWASRLKFMRHADARWDLQRILRSGFFDQYENRQSRPVLHRCDYVMSFLGERGTRSRFLGCHRVAGIRAGAEKPLPEGYPYPDMPLSTYWYDLERVEAFRDLENRVVIDWGKVTRSWIQRASPRRVIEVYPEGHATEFTGYEDVVLPFSELERIVRNPDANRTWHLMLRAVAAVYLITITSTGEQYIGSAYGEGGLLRRWECYARDRHGGNKLLCNLLERSPRCYVDFQFSILRTLPITMTAREVVAIEAIYKRKLGTRAHGLNAN